ncbi:MAG: class I SAM-dependent methyltransferase [Candidatus Melainabacteria bacterium]|nr:class I SAM-dependent methyltransferase [Candidatus Melainabacteria bacterium]
MERAAYPNYRAIKGTSESVGSSWPKEQKIDVLFIDGSHDFASVLLDLQTWMPHVREGGIVCGDDWNHEDREDIGGSVRKAFQMYFHLDAPNQDLSGNFWCHKTDSIDNKPESTSQPIPLCAQIDS